MNAADVKHLFNYTVWANDLAMVAASRLVDQMHHVANHATMHRGQVVGMIRQLGIDPPSTDLIFYVRREISPK